MLIPAGPEAAAVARSERNQGRAPNMKFMDHDRLGFNYRLTDIQAAIGVAQLERLDELLGSRAGRRGGYSERLAAIGAAEPGAGDPDDLVLPLGDRGRGAAELVRLRRSGCPPATDRDAVIAELDRRGIDARPYLPCIHLSDLYRERFGTRRGPVPGRRGVLAPVARAAVPPGPPRGRRSSGSSPSSPTILGRSPA